MSCGTLAVTIAGGFTSGAGAGLGAADTAGTGGAGDGSGDFKGSAGAATSADGLSGDSSLATSKLTLSFNSNQANAPTKSTEAMPQPIGPSTRLKRASRDGR